MTTNPDLERELALVVERESLAVAVRVLGLLYAEVVRLNSELERLNTLHTNARPGHGYATMAGEHSTPIERAVHTYTTDKAVTEYLASKERDYWAKE